MPVVDVVVETPVERSFRVAQVAGMFDVTLEAKMRHEWHIDLPIEDREWRIGAIVGPSGSGKSTLGQRIFGAEAYHRGYAWPAGSILDAFPESATSHEITAALSAVGFASPPAWVKPFDVLSNGERFRVELARLLFDDRPLVVVDEFTSVVDRTVAQIGSAAVAKTLRRGSAKQLVVLSCHYDFLEWLAPDWILDLKTSSFQWAQLHRPSIELDIARVGRAAWRMFAPHHYLSAKLAPTATCYGGWWRGDLVGFVAVLPNIGHSKMRRESRVVVLPDYQGLGIGNALAEAVADLWRESGHRYTTTTSHPGRISYLARSPKWAITNIFQTGAAQQAADRGDATARTGLGQTSAGRAVISAEYLPRATFVATKGKNHGGNLSSNLPTKTKRPDTARPMT